MKQWSWSNHYVISVTNWSAMFWFMPWCSISLSRLWSGYDDIRQNGKSGSIYYEHNAKRKGIASSSGLSFYFSIHANYFILELFYGINVCLRPSWTPKDFLFRLPQQVVDDTCSWCSTHGFRHSSKYSGGQLEAPLFIYFGIANG